MLTEGLDLHLFDGLTKEESIAILKHKIISYIDGNWGIGIQHLPMLKLLCNIDPDDQYLKEIYDKFMRAISSSDKEKYNEIAAELNDKSKHPMLLGTIKASDIEAEGIFRDQPWDYDEHDYSKKVIEAHPDLKEKLSWWWYP